MKRRKSIFTRKQLGALLAVLVVAGLGCGLWAIQIKTNAHELQRLIGGGSKEAGLNAYVEVVANPNQFGWLITSGGASYNAAKLCFVKDQDGFIYIVQMNDKTYEKLLASPDLPGNPFVLTGITRKITEDMKETTISALKWSGDDTVTLEGFEDRFGYLYLDTRSGYKDEAQMMAAVLCAIGAFVTFWNFIRAPKDTDKLILTDIRL